MKTKSQLLIVSIMMVLLCSCASPLKKKLLSGEMPHFDGPVTPISVPVELRQQELTPINVLGNKCLVGVSSCLSSDYLPHKMFDENFSTAWVSKHGVNEWIRLTCDEPVHILFLTVTNGYTESEFSYNSYSRIREIKLSFDGFERDVRLMDSSVTSYIPVMASIKELKITITDTYDAILNSGVAVSEVGFVSKIEEDLNHNDREFADYKYPKFVLEEVSDVRLDHDDSITEFVIRHGLGRPLKEKLLPESVRAYYNRYKNQCLLFVTHPGGYYVNQIVVSYTKCIDELLEDPGNVSKKIKDNLWQLFSYEPNKCGIAYATYIEHFESDDGISLDINKKQLVEILGEPHQTQEHGTNEILIYKADNMEKFEFLRLHNIPEYRGVYLFYKDELVWFISGFPYP